MVRFIYPELNSHVITSQNSESRQHGPCPRTFAAHQDTPIYLTNRGQQWLVARYAAVTRITDARPGCHAFSTPSCT
jgi:hypothetical protein